MSQDPGKPQSPPAKSGQPPAGKDTPGKETPPPGKDALTAPGKDGQAIPDKTDQGTVEDALPPGKVEQPAIPLQAPPAVQGVAPIAPPPEPFRIGSILEPALLLIAILVVGAIILAWLKRSRQKEELATNLLASDQLATFRHAMEEGDMTPEEFKKVKERLKDKLREPLHKPPPPVTPEAGPGTTTGGDAT